jgi:hypothetical protein
VPVLIPEIEQVSHEVKLRGGMSFCMPLARGSLFQPTGESEFPISAARKTRTAQVKI